MNEQLTLDQVLEAFWDRKIKEVHTAFPGMIIKYDASTSLATVQPLLQVQYQDDLIPTNLPNIGEVPVLHPRTKLGRIHLPVGVGDVVTVICAEQSIADWISGAGQPVYPSDTRHHSMSDAYCILGGYPEGLKFPIEAKDNCLQIDVIPGVKISIGNGVTELITELIAVIDALITATAGGFPLVATQLPAIKTKLETLKS